MLELKRYQSELLEKLNTFLCECLVDGAEKTFIKTKSAPGLPVPVYRTFGLGDIPYICLRIPTGGGKTLLASYCIRDAALTYLQKDNPLVLWLVPTTAILNQTLKALNDTKHPYRLVLQEYFGGKVEVFNINQVNTIKPQDLRESCTVVVGTVAALRVSSTEGRLVYGHDEAFDNHYAKLPVYIEGLECENGNIKHSFANLCYLKKPIIIMDEAHNVRTQLSFEFIKRLNPAAIFEFTATPDQSAGNGSNILASVTALELKTEQMIKLPIVLTEHSSWEQAVASTVVLQAELKQLASREADYIRPIALYQAEAKNKEVTWEALQKHLIENENIPVERIAIATGDEKGLKDVDLFDPYCKIEHIITVEALKEGWDCSFAYIFCTMTSRTSSKDVEQILGRVLRMPYAKERQNTELNVAYAHVASPTFSQAAHDLKDAMVDKLGFEKQEAEVFVQKTKAAGESPDQFDLFAENQEVQVEVSTFDPIQVDGDCSDKYDIRRENGRTFLNIHQGTSINDREKILLGVPEDDKARVKEIIKQAQVDTKHEGGQIDKSKAPMKIPRLVKYKDQTLLMLDSGDFLDYGDWNLNRFPAELPEFNISEEAQVWTIDISKDQKVKLSKGDAYQEINFDKTSDVWEPNDLIFWLDNHFEHKDIVLADMLEFIRRIVKHLLQEKQLPLNRLVEAKYVLVNQVKNLVDKHRETARKDGYQRLIGNDDCDLSVDFNNGFSFDPKDTSYPAKSPYYNGSYTLKKHLYPIISNMNGEEEKCAHAIDIHPLVSRWLRNVERQPEYSFWLPTASDRFYPDFVAELTDGRILVVEYKGEMLITTEDTEQKKLIGKAWEKASQGRCLFLMAVNRDGYGNDVYRQIQNILS